MNNEHILVEKTVALEALKKVQDKNEKTTTLVVEACRTILQLHIPKEASVKAKTRKLVVGVHNVKIEMAKV